MNNKKEEEFLALSEFQLFMVKHGDCYTHDRTLSIDLNEKFIAEIMLCDKGPIPLCLCIELEADDPELMKKLNFRTIADVEDMDQQAFLSLYKKGIGYAIGYFYEAFGFVLKFRLQDGKTIVFSDELDYYHTLEKQLFTIDHFREYLRDHIRDLYMALEEADALNKCSLADKERLTTA